jgi:drug/metabolite transporter (DMT)-like permease
LNKTSVLTSPAPDSTATENLAPNQQNQLITDGFSLILLGISIAALAFAPILTKLSELELSPTATTFNRFWISTVIIGCWQLIGTWQSEERSLPKSNHKSDYNYQETGLLILASGAATVSTLLWAISFTQTSIASATVIRSLTPLFISLGAWLVLKQSFKSQFMIGMMLAIAGGIAIGLDDLQLGNDYLVGDGIALLSAALHGVSILTVGYLRDRGCTTDRVLLWRCVVGLLIILPLVLQTDTQLFPMSLQGWLWVIALAVVCHILGQGLFVFSLKQFSSSFVGIFALLKPLFTALLAWIIFAEGINLTSAIALVLILFGIYLAKSSESFSRTNERSYKL